MSRPELSASSSAYLDRVARLLADIDEEDRLSLLADLTNQLEDLPEAELGERLGRPESFAAEYRRSAGIEQPERRSSRDGASIVAAVVSVLALPFGVLLLFSFGGQLIVGPFAVAIEWILARVSPRPLRFVWCLLAAALAGEIVYLALDIYVPALEGLLAVVLGLAAAALVALVFYRTTGAIRAESP